MYTINKITSSHVVDFAAEELKKYLRMMMPRCGEIDIRYAPDSEDGFRLGLMTDMGLDTSDALDLGLDDIVYIDTDERGGILAGSNPRSVLFAVYKYLRECGCRWLFPGVDGEYIPVADIKAVKYRKMADCRYRGQCNEGAEAQHLMIDEIDFTAKLGLNIFMIEFDNPKVYYDRYYDHQLNTENRKPEPVSAEQVLQWKRQCEAEISKRGLQFHDMGHGWCMESFGIDTTIGWFASDESTIPEESRQFIAEVGGKRKLWDGIALNTNFCMSNPEARGRFVKKISDYAALATNVDYLHVWLADGFNNHCECAECRKMTPSDYYVKAMNELDAELTARGLSTRIVFICYLDTTWAPEVERIINPDRFSLLVAAITRDYAIPVSSNLSEKEIPLSRYVRNNVALPTTVDEYIAHGREWQRVCNVSAFVYEYHYWWPQYRDLGIFSNVRILHDDVIGYKAAGLNGIVEDGSQRSFFPNGLSFAVYAETLFDTSMDLNAFIEDYLAHAYGEGWQTVRDMFVELGEAADFNYFIKGTVPPEELHCPEIADKIREVSSIVSKYEEFVRSHANMPKRAQTVMYRVLYRYLEYAKVLSEALATKAEGKDREALKMVEALRVDFGKYELEMERCYDQRMCFGSLNKFFHNMTDNGAGVFYEA